MNYTTAVLQTTTFTMNVTQPIPYTVAPSDVAYLQASGVAFCSSFIRSAIPTNTAIITFSPSGTLTHSITETSTIGYFSTSTDSTLHWRRAPSNDAAGMQRRLPPSSYPGSVPTPTIISGWPACMVSQACAQVATDISTSATTTSTFLPTFTANYTQHINASAITASCVEPPKIRVTRRLRAYVCNMAPLAERTLTRSTDDFTWDGDAPRVNDHGDSRDDTELQIPFQVCVANVCSDTFTINTDGYAILRDSQGGQAVQLSVFEGMSGSGDFVYPGNSGVFYRVAGQPGARSVVLAWYTSTDDPYGGSPSKPSSYSLPYQR